MMKRKWSCQKKMYGYLIQLDYGDKHLCTFVENDMITHSISPTQYIEYRIIRLNQELAESIFPLARNLDHWSIQKRYI